MDEQLQILWNHDSQITREDLIVLLNELGSLLPDPLSDRINVFEYSQKLLERANIVYARTPEKIIGLVAIYANDQIHNISHIPFVSISQEYQHKGIGRLLMQQAIDFAQRSDMKKIWLYVHVSNIRAHRFYESLGFASIDTTDCKITYELLFNQK